MLGTCGYGKNIRVDDMENWCSPKAKAHGLGAKGWAPRRWAWAQGQGFLTRVDTYAMGLPWATDFDAIAPQVLQH